jgi:transcription initiation factor TFIID subunit TAF12
MGLCTKRIDFVALRTRAHVAFTQQKESLTTRKAVSTSNNDHYVKSSPSYPQIY